MIYSEFFHTYLEVLIMSGKESRALQDALASTRMEGFEVTKQTEQDCLRLMNGEISVSELVREILARPEKAV